MSQTKSTESKLQTALEELSPREQLVVKGLLAGKTQSQALLDAGYSESVAMKQQKKVIGRARVQNALAAAMEDSGIDVDLLARTIMEGLNAVRLVSSGPGKPPVEVPDQTCDTSSFRLFLCCEAIILTRPSTKSRRPTRNGFCA